MENRWTHGIQPAALFLAACLLAGALQAAEPRLTFDQTEHDFGQVKGQSVLEHVFTFKNAGDAELEIKDIRSNCGCLAVLGTEGRKTKYAPGEAGEIRVKLTTASFIGPMSHRIFLYVNAPQAVSVLRTFAFVEPPAGWKPPEANPPPAAPLPKELPQTHIARRDYDFGEVVRGEVVECSFPISNLGTAPLVITQTTPQSRGLKAVLRRNTIPPTVTEPLSLTFDTTTHRGPQRAQVLLRTNDPAQPVQLFQMLGTVLLAEEAKAGKLVLAQYYFSSDCENCAPLEPVFARVRQKYAKDVMLRRVNVDNSEKSVRELFEREAKFGSRDGQLPVVFVARTDSEAAPVVLRRVKSIADEMEPTLDRLLKEKPIKAAALPTPAPASTSPQETPEPLTFRNVGEQWWFWAGIAGVLLVGMLAVRLVRRKSS